MTNVTQTQKDCIFSLICGCELLSFRYAFHSEYQQRLGRWQNTNGGKREFSKKKKEAKGKL